MKGAPLVRSCLHLNRYTVLFAVWFCLARLSVQAEQTVSGDVRLVFTEGKVDFSQAGAADWQPASTNNILRTGYRLRTSERSRAMLLWSDHTTATIKESTLIEVLSPDSDRQVSGIQLWRGLMSFFHRDEPGRFRVLTRSAMAGVDGTEFVVAVDPATEATTVSVIDGKVSFTNEFGSLSLTNLQQAVAEPGKAPVRTPGFSVNRVIQWCFYYPGILNVDELPLSEAERKVLEPSISAYRQGDLLTALNSYPAARQAQSAPERVFYAALLLSVGLAEQSELSLSALEQIATDDQSVRLANALRLLIDVVRAPGSSRSSVTSDGRGRPDSRTVNRELSDITTATEALAISYQEQSQALREVSLTRALAAARRATELAPTFGFAWARVADLEFSFGRTRDALEAVGKVLGSTEDGKTSIGMSPRNAQAYALRGFLLAAQNKTRLALDSFDQALAIDPALGNAWLGRGLCKIRLTPIYFSFHRELGVGVRGNDPDQMSALEDLLVAASVEPQRAMLRSYLGKAWAEAGYESHASNELNLSKNLDPADPTPWLYSALILQGQNQVNAAVRDLDHAMAINKNRLVYRSDLLLDQDEAVRSANLARVYADLGMVETAVREAGRAISLDYANYASHLFLANSFSLARDARLVNLRLETPAEIEYLLANLLAPVAAGTLSPTISSQEYSALYERNRFGFVSSAEYLSSGDWSLSGSQSGIFDKMSYSVDAFYRSKTAQDGNGHLWVRQISATSKQALTDNDTIFLRVSDLALTSGDMFYRYSLQDYSPTLRIQQNQEPLLLFGYHHTWTPQSHTLILSSYLEASSQLFDEQRPAVLRFMDNGNVQAIRYFSSANQVSDHQNLQSFEVQQIWGAGIFQSVLGARTYLGRMQINNRQYDPLDQQPYFPDPPVSMVEQALDGHLFRSALYGYESLQVLPDVQIVGGLSYESLRFPENFLSAPMSSRQKHVAQISPKAGFIWTPNDATTLRFAFSRSLGGFDVDQSLQIEPSQIAGFVQTYRSLIPETVTGGNSGERMQTLGVSLEKKFESQSYVGVLGEILSSEASRTLGAFEIDPTLELYARPSAVRQDFDYSERSIAATFDQLLGSEWIVGLRYRLSDAELSERIQNDPWLRDSSLDSSVQRRSLLHEARLKIGFRHACGVFSNLRASWYSQINRGYYPPEPGDSFWHYDLFVGYSFPKRRAEFSVGILNLADQEQRLEPLNIVNDLGRQRTFLFRLIVAF